MTVSERHVEYPEPGAGFDRQPAPAGKFSEWPPKLHVRGHMELRPRFDLHLNDEVKKFLWIATLLDPRFKKLDCFKGLGCEDLIGSKQRTRVAAWLRIEYDKNYKNHVSAPTEASGPTAISNLVYLVCDFRLDTHPLGWFPGRWTHSIR